jgi:hypothetical protein
MREEILVSEKPTPMATAYVARGYDGIAILGEVIKTTAKSIWIDTTKTQCFIWKGTIRYNRCKNGQWSGYGEKHWLYFEPDPLVEFISNGKQK